MNAPEYYNVLITDRVTGKAQVDGKEMMDVLFPTIQDCLENLYLDESYLPADYWQERITQACLDFIRQDMRVYTHLMHMGNTLTILVDLLPDCVNDLYVYNRLARATH